MVDSLSPLTEAVAIYLSRRDRLSHPSGHRDRGGRWQPSACERQACCDKIRPPSKAYPWSLMTHCRSAEHVAQLYHVDLNQLRRMARAVEREQARLAETHPIDADPS